jgi:hypothetical protein
MSVPPNSTLIYRSPLVSSPNPCTYGFGSRICAPFKRFKGHAVLWSLFGYFLLDKPKVRGYFNKRRVILLGRRHAKTQRSRKQKEKTPMPLIWIIYDRHSSTKPGNRLSASPFTVACLPREEEEPFTLGLLLVAATSLVLLHPTSFT